MKIKVFGLTVFELQQDTPPMPSGKPPGTRAAVAKPRCPAPAAVASPPRPLADLDRAAELLPRTSRETLDVNATLRLFGLKDAAVLWQRNTRRAAAGRRSSGRWGPWAASQRCLQGGFGRIRKAWVRARSNRRRPRSHARPRPNRRPSQPNPGRMPRREKSSRHPCLRETPTDAPISPLPSRCWASRLQYHCGRARFSPARWNTN